MSTNASVGHIVHHLVTVGLLLLDICGNENILYGFSSLAGYVQQSKDVLSIV